MTQYARHKLMQWRRYEFIRDYGLETAEERPVDCAEEMMREGLFPADRRGRSGMVNGVRTICREMRKGWKPTPIDATPNDVMMLLCGKIAGPVPRIELTPDESALIWSAVQRWVRNHEPTLTRVTRIA